MKTLIKSALAAMLLPALLAACADSDSRLMEIAQNAVSSELKDPGSAQFVNGRIIDFPDPSTKFTKLKYACGEVNAKNSFGAYAGAVRYVVLLGVPNDGSKYQTLSVDLEKTPRDPVFTASFWAGCAKQ